MTAVITGASSGMGAQYAKDLAKRKYDLILVARSEDKLKELKKEIEAASGVKVEVFPLDLTKSADLDKLIKRAPEVDLLINNAGVTMVHALTDEMIRKTQMMLRLNVEAPTMLTLGFLKVFKERNSGRIINVGSAGAFAKSSPPFASYSPGKLYVERFTRSLRHELEISKSDVKLHLVHPGSIATEMNRMNEQEGKKPTPTTPVEKFTEVVLHRILDKGWKEFHYGKLGTTMKLFGKFTTAKFQARMNVKMMKDYS